MNNDVTYKISEGTYAINVYRYVNDLLTEQMTIDPGCDAIYIQFNNEWITLSTGPKTPISEFYKIDTYEKKQIFKGFGFKIHNDMKYIYPYFKHSISTLEALVDLFV